MTVFEAIFLGIVQGLTEFLPISSTAHLTLAGKLLNLITTEEAASWTAFIAVIQLGTLAAVVVYFFDDVREMGTSLLSDLTSHGQGRGFRGYGIKSWLGIYVVVGTIPVGLAGLLLSDLLHGMFTKSTVVIIVSLVTLAAFLWLAEKLASHKRTIEDITVRDAFIIGAAQALALIPGASRSGTTLTAGLFLGLTRPAAARFSFLLSIPAIFASGVYEVTKIDPSVFTFGIANLVVATVASAISGYLAIAWLLKYLATHSTMVFVWYRFGLGVLLTLMLVTGLIQP